MKQNETKTFIYKRRNDEQCIKMFNNKLRQENWNSVVNVDVNIVYDNFLKLFLIYYDECCPIQKIYVNNKTSKPWMTTSLKSKCEKKHICIGCLKNKTEENERKHKKYKIKLTAILKYCKKDYYANLLIKYKNNIKQIWKILNTITKGDKNEHSTPAEFLICKGNEINKKSCK